MIIAREELKHGLKGVEWPFLILKQTKHKLKLVDVSTYTIRSIFQRWAWWEETLNPTCRGKKAYKSAHLPIGSGCSVRENHKGIRSPQNRNPIGNLDMYQTPKVSQRCGWERWKVTSTTWFCMTVETRDWRRDSCNPHTFRRFVTLLHLHAWCTLQQKFR